MLYDLKTETTYNTGYTVRKPDTSGTVITVAEGKRLRISSDRVRCHKINSTYKYAQLDQIQY